MLRKILSKVKLLALSAVALYVCPGNSFGQEMATPEQKAKALYITPQKKESSVERREENANTSAEDLETPIGYKYVIKGPEKVDRYSKQTYYCIPRAPQDGWWYVSSGQVLEYYDDFITIDFNSATGSYVEIILFGADDRRLGYLKVLISADTYPLSAGTIETGSQSLRSGQIPANLKATPAQGGNCGMVYNYQWQYSDDDVLYRDIEDAIFESLVFESDVNSTVYFRRKVRCSVDSQYTGSVAVFFIPGFSAGNITTLSQLINYNTAPPQIQATPGMNGECGSYTYQWQLSVDGYEFINIPNATSQNLSYSSQLTSNTFFRRKTFCTGESRYTNTIIIRPRPAPNTTPIVRSEIDSVLIAAGVNLASIFNIPSDSIANNRPAANPALDSLLAASDNNALLMTLNNPGSSVVLEQTTIDSLINSPLQDDIAARLEASENGSVQDTTAVRMVHLSDSVIQSYISSGLYEKLDSLVNTIPTLSVDEIIRETEEQRVDSLPEAQRSYVPQINAERFIQGIVVNGPSMVQLSPVYRYTASFYFPPGSNPVLHWNAHGGIIMAQNINPAAGPIWADIKWTAQVSQKNVSLTEATTEQFGSLNVYSLLWDEMVVPIMQKVFYGQTPSILQANITGVVTNGLTHKIQWQVLDIYGIYWTDIPGALTTTTQTTSLVSYQPTALLRPWMMYRCKISSYNGSTLINSYFTEAASIQLHGVDPGFITIPITRVLYNHPPVVNQSAAFGGFTPTGTTGYSYIWEASVNGGSWTQIGTTAAFPNYLVRDHRVSVRRKATVSGGNPNLYLLPSHYWTATSPVFDLTYYYTSVDFENRNYIRENAVLTRGINNYEDADLLPLDKKTQVTTYFDGLSRTIQIVDKGTHYDQGSSQWYDMVQHITYGPGGRVDKSLLPYSTTDNPGKFKTNVTTAQPAYYLSKFGENNAFAKVDFDGSPINRVVREYGAGDSWIGANLSTYGELKVYNSNLLPVPRFTVGYNQGEIPIKQGVYPTGKLFLYMNQDEKGKTVLSYINKAGQMILQKIQMENLATSNDSYLCTYYVYDDYGQLRFTITPKAFKEIELNNWVITPTVANELCFWFDYDDIGRSIAKKSPGKETEFTVYDRKNRPVFMQDAGCRLSEPGNPLLTTLYDDLNRPVMTGMLYNSTINSWNTFITADPTAILTVNTTYGGTIRIQGSPLTAAQINDPAVFRQLSFNYYDNHNYSNAKVFDANHIDNLSYKNSITNGNVETAVLTKRSMGMATGKKVRIIESNPSYIGAPRFILNSVYYDDEGRLIQNQKDNIKGGVEITSMQYHFDGRVLSASETHNGNGTAYTNFNILTKFKFDKIGRMVGIGKKLNDPSRNYISSQFVVTAQEDADAGYKITTSYEYNELNQRVKKTFSPGYNSGAGLETIDYSYNLRGWLTGINKEYALGEYNSSQWDHYFGMYLGYDNKDGKFAAGQFNGKLTGTLWKSQGDNTPRKFDYEYDNAYRLTAALFNQKEKQMVPWNHSVTDFSTKDISYDKNGNLLTMTQMGILPGSSTPIMLDNLAYVYQNQSNKLTRVSDMGNAGAANGKLGDFKDGGNVDGAADYSYDENGRLQLDYNKKISSVTYNFFNKPETIIVSDPSGGSIRYVYSVEGVKLQKVVTMNASPSNGNHLKVITTSYVGAYVYESITVDGTAQPEELQMISHEEGRIRIITPYNNPNDPANFIGGGIPLPNGKQGVFDYFIQDNLGNIRATITEEINRSSSICTMEDALPTIAQYEQSIFGNPGSANEVANTRANRMDPSLWTSSTQPPQTALTNLRASHLQATGGQPATGPNAFLKVMAGDKISAFVDYYYRTDPGNSATNLGLNALLSSLASALTRTTAITHGHQSEITTTISNNGSVQDMFNNSPPPAYPNAPRAYMNYIFFDEQFNFVGQASGFKRVEQPGNGHSLVLTPTQVIKNGYVYVYLSNESGEPVDFDNFTVSHEKGQLIAEDHYYAYGLKIAAISSKALSSSLNTNIIKYGFQASFAEEINDLELNYNEFQLRTYDPQIGRWTTPDPYNEFPSQYTGMGNDPVNNVDPDGGGIDFGTVGDVTGSIIGDRLLAAACGAVVGWSIDKLSGDDGWTGAAIGAVVGFGITFIPPIDFSSIGKAAVDVAPVLVKSVMNVEKIVQASKKPSSISSLKRPTLDIPLPEITPPQPDPVNILDDPRFAYVRVAGGEIGTTEVPGPRANPRITMYHRNGGRYESDESEPWCASFLNYCLRTGNPELGRTNSPASSSFYLQARRIGLVQVPRPFYGSIMVRSNNGKFTGGTGHVAIVVGVVGEDGYAQLGGNQAVPGSQEGTTVNTVLREPAANVRYYHFVSLPMIPLGAPLFPTATRGVQRQLGTDR